MAYIHHFVDCVERTNNEILFKYVAAVFLIWFVCSLYTLLFMQEFSVKGLKNSCLFGLIYTFISCIIFFILVLWLDIAWFYSINTTLAFFIFLVSLICLIAIYRFVKKRRLKNAAVVVAPPPIGKAIIGNIELEETENQENE